jgi:hypothetical protein
LLEEAPYLIFKQSHLPSHHTPMVKINKGRSLTFKKLIRTLHWRCPKKLASAIKKQKMTV